MTFFSGLRDDTAGPLIEQFGQAGIYRVYGSSSYDNATGLTTPGSPTDTAIVLLDLPLKEREFSEDVAAHASGMLLVAAQQFAAAAVVPEVDKFVVFGSKTYKILAINTVGPSGEAVIYKMAVQYV
jgi:hypothetical protein